MITPSACVGARKITETIRQVSQSGKKVLSAFVTAGFPTRVDFAPLLRSVASEADIIEIGVPFSDPMADGVTIQESSRVALENGITVREILEVAASVSDETPLVLMSYLNPLLAYGLDRLARDASNAGIAGFVIPDLPLEECMPVRDSLNRFGLALIQLVSPVSPADRLVRICNEAQGFVYAVTVTGVTGQRNSSPDLDLDYLDSVRDVSSIPVIAGFGIRNAEQFDLVTRHADGAIVGSALLEALGRGDDPVEFLRGLRSQHQDTKELRA